VPVQIGAVQIRAGSESASDNIALSAGAPQALNARGDTIAPWVGVFLSHQVAALLPLSLRDKIV
jgi:hypothetical protein